MKATTTQVTMQEYASDNTEYKSSPNDSQTAAGVVPLDTLPAAWWNWLWSMVTKNNNAIYLSIGDLRDEMLAVLTNAGITPSDTVTNQLLQAIEVIRKRFPTTDAVSSDPVPGAVISSGDIKSVSVSPTTGQMVVNALADWAGTDTIKEFLDAYTEAMDTWKDEQEQLIADKVEELEDTIEGRAHVIALNVANNSSTDTALMLTATSRVDGGSLDAYTPAAGDMIVLVCPTAVQELTDRVSLTLTIGSNQLTYTNSDGITLGQSNVFTLITFASASGTMVMTSGTGSGGGLQYFKTITTVVDPEDDAEWYGMLLIGFTGYTPQYGDIIRIENLEYSLWGAYMYTRDGWVVIDSGSLIPAYGQTATSTSIQRRYSVYGASIQMYLGKSCPYLGATTGDDYYYLYTNSLCIDVFSSKPLNNLTGFNIIGYDLPSVIATSDISADFRRIYVAHIFKVGTAFRLNNDIPSSTNLCYADAQGNLHAHTLELT